MTESTELNLLFLERYQEYLLKTQEILETIPHVLEGIKQTLVNEDYQSLQWEDAQYRTEDSTLVLTGNVAVVVGDDIALNDGRTVTVTEENVGTLRRLVRVGIPMAIAETGSVEDVVEYLSDKQHRDYDTMPQSAEDLTEEEVEKYHSEYLKNEMENVLGFDTEGLTDEQVESILLNSKDEKIH